MKHFSSPFLPLLCSATSTQAAPLGSRTVLDTDAVLLVAERPGIPMVVMSITFKMEPLISGKAGLANLKQN
jgi:hypothetical protein